MGQGDLDVKDQIGGLTSDLLPHIVLAGHDELSAFLADLLEDPVVTAAEQLVGVTALLRLALAATDHPVQLGAGIRRRWQGVASSVAAGVLGLVETASGPGVTGHISGLFNAQQQHIGVAVVPKAPQDLGVAAGGSLVPELSAGTAPVVHLSAAQGVLDRLPVHPGHHENGSVQPVLCDSWQQAGVVKTELVDEGGAGGLHQASCFKHCSDLPAASSLI